MPAFVLNSVHLSLGKVLLEEINISLILKDEIESQEQSLHLMRMQNCCHVCRKGKPKTIPRAGVRCSIPARKTPHPDFQLNHPGQLILLNHLKIPSVSARREHFILGLLLIRITHQRMDRAKMVNFMFVVLQTRQVSLWLYQQDQIYVQMIAMGHWSLKLKCLLMDEDCLNLLTNTSVVVENTIKYSTRKMKGAAGWMELLATDPRATRSTILGL